MARETNKTVQTPVCFDKFIAAIANEGQRADSLVLREMMERLSGEPAVMWGASIIGFGTYHYKYDSGREGNMARVGFSPRKGKTVVYLVDGYEGKDAKLTQLGKHKTGKSCVYIKRLADVDAKVLEEMVADSLAYMAKQYPA